MAERVWDSIWSNKKTISDYSLNYYAFLRSMAKAMPAGASVAELGCGSGEGLAGFSRQKAFGFDLSSKALELAGQFSTVVRGDLFKMPVKSESFDLVFNSGVLEHFPEPNNFNAALEMVRVAKKGGKVIIILPNAYCWWYRLFKYLSIKLNKKWEFGYEEEYPHARLKELAKRAGLTIEKSFGLQVLPPLATNNISLAPRWLRRILIKLDIFFPFREHYAFGTGVVCRKQ